MLSLVLAEKILSLFIIMAMGFALVRSGLMKPELSRGVSLANLYVITPCMIISSFQVTMTSEVVRGFLLAFLAGVIIHALYLALGWLGHKLPFPRFDAVEQASAIYSNAGNLVIPLVVMTLGQDMVIYCTAFVVIQTFLMWSHAKALLRGGFSRGGIDWRQILLSVNMIAIYVGVVLFVTGIRLPGPLADAVSQVGNMIGPSSMLVTGMIMGGLRLGDLRHFRRLPIVVIARLVAFPLAALAILRLTPLCALAPNGTSVLLITLLGASAPSASTINQMAQIYDRDAGYASAINVATILCCIVTMPLMVALYQL